MEIDIIYVTIMSAFTEYLAAEIVKLLPEYEEYIRLKALDEHIDTGIIICENKDCLNWILYIERESSKKIPYLVTNSTSKKIDKEPYEVEDCESYMCDTRDIFYCSLDCAGGKNFGDFCHLHRPVCKYCDNYSTIWCDIDGQDCDVCVCVNHPFLECKKCNTSICKKCIKSDNVLLCN